MFGGNFLTEHLDDRNQARKQAKQLNARLHVVMSDAGDTSFAKALKQDSPDATVIFRPYFADDKRWPDTGMSAEAVWDAHRRYATEGLAVQVGNEIGFSPAWMAMCVKVSQFARQENKQVALVTPGVGNYAPEVISGGGLDALLLELAADRRVIGSVNPPNLLSVHEYAQQSTFAEQPYRIGRVKWMLDRATNTLKLNIDPRRVAITEYGRDVGGDPLNDGGMLYFNHDEEKFYNFLTPGALLYLQLGYLGAALYCQGRTWPSFDWQHAQHLIDLMAAWNAAHPAIPIKTYAPGTNPLVMWVNLSKGIRLHTLPAYNSPTIRAIPYDEQVTVYQDPQEHADNFFWARVDTRKHESGWSALVVEGVPSFTSRNLPQPPPSPIPSPAPTPGSQFRLALPVAIPARVAQRFGTNVTGIADFYTRWDLPAHEGIDFGGAMGDPVYAAAAGTIKAINIPGKNGIVPTHAYGIHVKIAHVDPSGQAWETDYCHLSGVSAGLRVGMDTIQTGERIGSVGMTGSANGRTHLHFMLRKAGATARGERQTIDGGRKVVYKNDIIDPAPYFLS